MWRKFPARGLTARLALFLLFLLAMWGMRAWLADAWRQGETAAARELAGPPQGGVAAARKQQ